MGEISAVFGGSAHPDKDIRARRIGNKRKKVPGNFRIK